MTAFSDGFDSSVCSRMMASAASLHRGSIWLACGNRADASPASPRCRYAAAHRRIVLGATPSSAAFAA